MLFKLRAAEQEHLVLSVFSRGCIEGGIGVSRHGGGADCGLLVGGEGIRDKAFIQPFTKGTGFPGGILRGICSVRVIAHGSKSMFANDQEFAVLLVKDEPFDLLGAVGIIIVLLICTEENIVSSASLFSS